MLSLLWQMSKKIQVGAEALFILLCFNKSLLQRVFILSLCVCGGGMGTLLTLVLLQLLGCWLPQGDAVLLLPGEFCHHCSPPPCHHSGWRDTQGMGSYLLGGMSARFEGDLQDGVIWMGNFLVTLFVFVDFKWIEGLERHHSVCFQDLLHYQAG